MKGLYLIPDKTNLEESRIESGKEAIIYQENEEEVLVILDEIDETLLPKDVLEFLQEEVVRDDHEIIYSDDKIIELLDKLESSEDVIYTVIFKYNGNIFATQEVKNGELVSKPKLKPAPSGSWDFDFTKPITEDTTIEFVE